MPTAVLVVSYYRMGGGVTLSTWDTGAQVLFFSTLYMYQPVDACAYSCTREQATPDGHLKAPEPFHSIVGR